jgi:PAS domain S-box-containing protein
VHSEREFPKPAVAYGVAVAAVLSILLLRLALSPTPAAFATFGVVAVAFAYLIRVMRQAQVAERRSALEWRTTLASIGDAVIVTDRYGKVRFLNPVAERLTGWTLNDALDRPLEEIFTVVDEDTSQPIESPVSRVLREGRPFVLAGHTLMRHKQGRWRPIADSGAPVRNPAGEIDGVVVVFRDQTGEREANRELRRSRGLLQAMSDRTPAVTYVKDLEGRYLFVNQSFLDLFQITRDTIHGKTDIDL